MLILGVQKTKNPEIQVSISFLACPDKWPIQTYILYYYNILCDAVQLSLVSNFIDKQYLKGSA